MSLHKHWRLPRPTPDRWLRDARGSATPQLAVGIFIMAFGVLLTLDRLQIMDAALVLRLWPLALVALGAAMLAKQPDAHGRFWGIGWMLVGAWLLLNTLGVVAVRFWTLFWPLVMVWLGVNLIRQALGRPATPVARDSDGSSRSAAGLVNLFAALCESKGNVGGEPLRGGSMTAFMGGCMLDARQAAAPPDGEAVINVFGVMGGLELWVPSGWTVVTDVASIMASVEDKRLPALAASGLAPGQVAPRLVIRGVIVMCGLTIKN